MPAAVYRTLGLGKGTTPVLLSLPCWPLLRARARDEFPHTTQEGVRNRLKGGNLQGKTNERREVPIFPTSHGAATKPPSEARRVEESSRLILGDLGDLGDLWELQAGPDPLAGAEGLLVP